MSQKTELLLPVGNVESFYAALQGGSDAIYLGLEQFNARGRAKNFTKHQLIFLLKLAHEKNISVYITLNTVIKNCEVPLLIEYLFFLESVGVNGIIIQDWGVLNLVRKYFSKLKIHASTQIGVHNSLGTRFSAQKGFKRTVLARELTFVELEKIITNAPLETEVFVHGALCYSFSGMCLFSGYQGGWGANRGLCTQPCRRIYTVNSKPKYLFNLKDNQLIDYVGWLKKIKTDSLKIEGRMKSGEYVYSVAKSYRMVLDDPLKTDEAKELLNMDFGREKTSYFPGKDINNAISEQTVTGILLGKVNKITEQYILIDSNMEIQAGFRLRFQDSNSGKSKNVKVKQVDKENGFFKIDNINYGIQLKSKVFLSGIKGKSFQSKFEINSPIKIPEIPDGFKRKILNELKTKLKPQKDEIYVRISDLQWLRKIYLNEVDGLFLSLSKSSMVKFNPNLPFIQKFRNKIFIELPKFIAEGSIVFYTQFVKRMVKNGINGFVISHLSQKLIIPKGCRIISNENVYVFNDAAAKEISGSVEQFIYPQENDFENLKSMQFSNGIVPVYFHPELFYSRMPVQLEKGEEVFTNDLDETFKRIRKDGITRIIPIRPVSLFQYKKRISGAGFYRFLIDVSYDKPSKNRLKTLTNRLFRSEQIQPSSTFNFMKGMK